MKLLAIAAIFLLLTALSAVSAPINILEDFSYGAGALEAGYDEQEVGFEPAWQDYLYAFNPIRDAMAMRDLSGVRPWLQHLKDASVKLSKAKTPERYEKTGRKLQKEVLSRTKAFLKAVKSKDREILGNAFNHLKDSVDRMEEIRINH